MATIDNVIKEIHVCVCGRIRYVLLHNEVTAWFMPYLDRHHGHALLAKAGECGCLKGTNGIHRRRR